MMVVQYDSLDDCEDVVDDDDVDDGSCDVVDDSGDVVMALTCCTSNGYLIKASAVNWAWW